MSSLVAGGHQVQSQPELWNELQDNKDNLESFPKWKPQNGHMPRVCEALNLSPGIQKQDEFIQLEADMKPRALLASHGSSLTASDPLSTPYPIFLCNRYPTRGYSPERLISSRVCDKNGTDVYVASHTLGFTKWFLKLPMGLYHYIVNVAVYFPVSKID